MPGISLDAKPRPRPAAMGNHIIAYTTAYTTPVATSPGVAGIRASSSSVHAFATRPSPSTRARCINAYASGWRRGRNPAVSRARQLARARRRHFLHPYAPPRTIPPIVSFSRTTPVSSRSRLARVRTRNTEPRTRTRAPPDGDGADVLDVRPRRIKRALHRKRSNLPARHNSSGFKQSTDSERETEIDRPERGEGLEMRRRRLGVDDARRRRRGAREDDDPHHRHLRDKYQNRHETIYVCRPTLRTP